VSLGERSIAEEVIRFAEHAMHQNWIGRDRLKISFLGYVQANRLDRIGLRKPGERGLVLARALSRSLRRHHVRPEPYPSRRLRRQEAHLPGPRRSLPGCSTLPSPSRDIHPATNALRRIWQVRRRQRLHQAPVAPEARRLDHPTPDPSGGRLLRERRLEEGRRCGRPPSVQDRLPHRKRLHAESTLPQSAPSVWAKSKTDCPQLSSPVAFQCAGRSRSCQPPSASGTLRSCPQEN
jgi:hypothetical protein